MERAQPKGEEKGEERLLSSISKWLEFSSSEAVEGNKENASSDGLGSMLCCTKSERLSAEATKVAAGGGERNECGGVGGFLSSDVELTEWRSIFMGISAPNVLFWG